MIINNASMTTEQDGETYNRTELSYEVPNWIGASPATFRINATLFTPTNASGDLGLLPGVVVTHGLGDRRSGMYTYALRFAALNCSVLVPDLPGHGDSGGALATPGAMLFPGDFNRTSHTYQVFCAGIQAVRMLESLGGTVDATRIAMTGYSYGGWTSLCVGAILNDKVDLVLPCAFWGNFSRFEPTSAWYMITNSTVEQSNAWLDQKSGTYDPINYIGIDNYPETCFIGGTNDEFFSYVGLNDTFNTVKPAVSKSLFIEPNGHHTVPSDHTPQFMVSHAFFGGPAPPVISGLPGQKAVSGVMDQVRVQVNVTSEAAVESVQVCYKYKGIIGDPWHVDAMVETSPGSGMWEGAVNAYWAGSEVDYYVIVTVANPDGRTRFTSQVYAAGYVADYIAFLPISGIVAAIALLAIAALKHRYANEVLNASPGKRDPAKIHFIAENAILGVTEALMFGSVAMPWINASRTLSFSLANVMNAYFAYPALLGNLAYSFAFLVFLLFTVYALVSLVNPLVAGILNALWPVLMLLIGTVIASALGMQFSVSLIGYGLVIFLISAIGQVSTWIWKQIYQKRLGIPRRTLITIVKEKRRKAAG